MLHQVALLEAAAGFSVLPHSDPVIRSTFQRHYDHLQQAYESRPLEVSFRELVGPLPAQELSHGIYPYPARLLRQIPRMLLPCEQITGDAEFVIDPFCGSGTVLLEAQLAGLEAIGFDQNPVAALVANVKTRPIDARTLETAIAETIQRAKRRRTSWQPPKFVERWYSDDARSILGRLTATLNEWPNGPTRDFIAVSIALYARLVANTDKRIPVPVRPDKATASMTRSALWEKYETTATELARKVATLPNRLPRATAVLTDARASPSWELLPNARKGLLLTSPPYGAAQKYVRSTSLEAAWLGYTTDRGTSQLERSSIGREHLSQEDVRSGPSNLVDPALRPILNDIGRRSESRSLIYLNYFLDMQRVLRNASEAESIQRIVLVAGTNVVTGALLDTREHLGRIANHYGFEKVLSLRDEIRGRAFMTKRRTSSPPGAAEYVEVFERIS